MRALKAVLECARNRRRVEGEMERIAVDRKHVCISISVLVPLDIFARKVGGADFVRDAGGVWELL